MSKKNRRNRRENAITSVDAPATMVDVADEDNTFSQEWFEENKDKLLEGMKEHLGAKILGAEEVNEDQVLAAAKEIGLDLETSNRGDSDYIPDYVDFVNRMASQLDLIMVSAQWASKMSLKDKIGAYAIRVFIRQARNETPPPGQAGTLKELFTDTCGLAEGVLNTTSNLPYPRGKGKKHINMGGTKGDNYLKAAGVIDKE